MMATKHEGTSRIVRVFRMSTIAAWYWQSLACCDFN